MMSWKEEDIRMMLFGDFLIGQRGIERIWNIQCGDKQLNLTKRRAMH